MKKSITKIEPLIRELPRRKKAAAYARVSLGTEDALHSLAAQVSHYNDLIQRNMGYEFAGVYADANESGTKENRPQFQRMLEDCRAGKIDLILTKSISRFARNTVTLLEAVRELKGLGIDVYFEEQNIHTLSGEGELLLTILASYAQEESRSISENIKWRKRNDMKSGKTKATRVYGYASTNGQLRIIPEEAKVVRLIYEKFLAGQGSVVIANSLNMEGIPSPWNKKWAGSTVKMVLTNPKMCGNLLHQRKFNDGHLSNTSKINRGELPMYFIEGTHEGIVTKEAFDQVQGIFEKNKKDGWKVNPKSAFSQKIVCASCGNTFWRATSGKGAARCYAWVCSGRDLRRKATCRMRSIPEPVLMDVAKDVLGLESFDRDLILEKVEQIVALDDRKLIFKLTDGSEVSATWHRRITIPYSKIGFEKRKGRNICYSKCGKGNMSEARRKRLEKLKGLEGEDNGNH